MKFTFGCIWIFLAAAAAKVVSIPAFSGRVTKGYNAPEGQFPNQCWLEIFAADGSEYFCGCVIVSERKVLTAGHCGEISDTTTVHFGSNDRTASSVTREAATVKVHPLYNNSNLNYDIAIVTFTQPLLFNAHIQPIDTSQAPNYEQNYVGDTVIFSGWGATRDFDWTLIPIFGDLLSKIFGSIAHQLLGIVGYYQLPVLLQAGHQPIIDNAQAVSTYGTDIVTDKKLFYSGGPVVVSVASIRKLIGITSFGPASGCTSRKPAGVMKFEAARPWFDEEMNN